MYDFLVDSHCHLKILADGGISLDEVVGSAVKNNVKILTNICTNIGEADEIINISKSYENVYCSVGHHPEMVSEEIIEVKDLLKYIDEPRVIAIGESGLDYYHNDEPKNKSEQRANFETHIEASRRSKLPLIVHSRNADSDMIELLESEMKNGEFSFILHCFCSGEKLALRGLDLGGFISFSGILTFKNATEVHDVAKKVPLDRIMVETDSPYLAPVPFRGKTNQPAYTRNTAEFLATLLGISFEKIQDITTSNFFKLFNNLVTHPILLPSEVSSGESKEVI